MENKFYIGEIVEVTDQDQAVKETGKISIVHGFKSGQLVRIETMIGDQVDKCVAIDNPGFYQYLDNYCVKKINNAEADINADIQAALDPNNYQRLTEFNRVSSYEGGGYKMPEKGNHTFSRYTL